VTLAPAPADPKRFLATVVRPNVAAFIAEPAYERMAVNAILTVDALVGQLYAVLAAKDDRGAVRAESNRAMEFAPRWGKTPICFTPPVLIVGAGAGSRGDERQAFAQRWFAPRFAPPTRARALRRKPCHRPPCLTDKTVIRARDAFLGFNCPRFR
jgi:hypothetical protein